MDDLIKFTENKEVIVITHKENEEIIQKIEVSNIRLKKDKIHNIIYLTEDEYFYTDDLISIKKDKCVIKLKDDKEIKFQNMEMKEKMMVSNLLSPFIESENSESPHRSNKRKGSDSDEKRDVDDEEIHSPIKKIQLSVEGKKNTSPRRRKDNQIEDESTTDTFTTPIKSRKDNKEREISSGETSSQKKRKIIRLKEELGTETITEFLNEKKIFHEKKHEKKKSQYYKCICNPIGFGNSNVDFFMSCQERLKNLLKLDGDWKFKKAPKRVQTFESFCEQINVWADDKKSHVFFRDNEAFNKIDNLLVQRTQQENTFCSINAPVVYHSYCNSSLKDKFSGMLDVTKLIRKKFTTPQLERYIFKDSEKSEDILSFLMVGDTRNKMKSVHINDLEEVFKQVGPIMVSRFNVFSDFFDFKVSSHVGEPSGSFEGLHSMLLIGFREEDNKKFYLLQNWWFESQFVEVDHLYLKGCQPLFSYVDFKETIDFNGVFNLGNFGSNDLDKKYGNI